MTVADTGGYLAPSYVAAKLKVSEGDAVVLAEIIARYTGRTALPWFDPRGGGHSTTESKVVE
jgi:hypothetical protein